MKKQHTLNSNLIDKFFDLQKEIGKIETIIHDRLIYIFKSIAEVCKAGKYETFWVDGAREGEVGDISPCFDGKYFASSLLSIYIKNREYRGDDGRGTFDVILGDEQMCLLDRFPMRWLYEDFEDELAEGRKQWLQFSEEQKKAVHQASQLQQDLIKSAKSKLTKAEKAALGIK